MTTKPAHIKVYMLVDETIGRRKLKRGVDYELIHWDAIRLIAQGKAKRSTGPAPAITDPIERLSDEQLIRELARRGKLPTPTLSDFSVRDLERELFDRGAPPSPSDFETDALLEEVFAREDVSPDDIPTVGDVRSGAADWNTSRATLARIGVRGRSREELADEFATWLELRAEDGTANTDDDDSPTEEG